MGGGGGGVSGGGGGGGYVSIILFTQSLKAVNGDTVLIRAEKNATIFGRVQRSCKLMTSFSSGNF